MGPAKQQVRSSFSHEKHLIVKAGELIYSDATMLSAMMLKLSRNLEGESFVHKTTTIEDEARLDIKANGLWDSRFCRTFFDVKIFNPLPKTRPKNVNEAYKFHESQKKLKY